MENASAEVEASAVWSHTTDTWSRFLVRMRAITVALPASEVGIKHSRNVPLLIPSGEADSSNCSLANTPSVSDLSAMRPRDGSARSGGKLRRTVHVEEAGNWIDSTLLSAFLATYPASGDVAVLTWRDNSNIVLGVREALDLSEKVGLASAYGHSIRVGEQCSNGGNVELMVNQGEGGE
eukprot:6490433-Amphidinium_carterae.1